MVGKKTKIIKVNLGPASESSHILDLQKSYIYKQQTEEVKEKSKLKIKDFVSELFIVSFAKVLIFPFVFLLKLIRQLAKLCIKKISILPKTINFRFKKKENIRASQGFYFTLEPPKHWARGLASFVLVAMVMILPIRVFSSYENLEQTKNDILSESLKGYEEFKQKNYGLAASSFASAKQNIDGINFALKNLVSLLPSFGSKFTLGNGLIIFGENISKAAASLDEGFEYFDGDYNVTDKIAFLKIKIDEAMPNILIAGEALDKIAEEKDLPIDVAPLRDMLRDGVRSLMLFSDFSPSLLDILGADQFKRYLFVFQNNTEIRPTGGFMGSFALVDVNRGKISKMEIPGGGTYDVKGQLKELVISPEPFHLINPVWQFQDSNWFPDFPTSAKKIMWFYEKSGGPSVDGVIAINANLMTELLAIIGSIDMPEYGKIITAENFFEETQKQVELEYDKIENKPKQFIADLAPKVLDQISNVSAQKLADFAFILHNAILSKSLQIFISDENMQNEISSFGLAGEMKDSNEFTDSLFVVDTNIAGQKTDAKIKREIIHNSFIDKDGSIINTVKIIRRHTGTKGAIFSGVRNVNYMRIYVPLGSELLDADGFVEPPSELFKKIPNGFRPDKDLELVQGPVYVDPKTGVRVNNEFGRTVFGNWVMVDPGEEVAVTIKYKLSHRFGDGIKGSSGLAEYIGLNKKFSSYKMLIEKQSGAENVVFKSYVVSKFGRAVASVGNVALQESGWQYETELDTNKYYGVVLE